MIRACWNVEGEESVPAPCIDMTGITNASISER